MRLPISWLKDYVEFNDTPKGLADKLTFSGTEVEAIETIGSTYEGVVVAEVLKVERHPNADKLTLCTVNPGAGQMVVVCGAPNVKAGGKYPFAQVGVTLPNGLKLKKAKIRGVESEGMLCAEDELGLSTDHAGLLELEAQWAPGTPLSEVLGPPETVLDLEITPNRPDCLSIIGLAREVAAMYGTTLKIPALALAEFGRPAGELTRVEVQDADGCPRYTARIMTGVKIGPSPDWMKRRLEAAGIRAINNVVDITNYVMLECGQPLHAFDQELLEEGRIVVRRVRPGEKMATLDNIERPISESMLVIADAKKPVAVAGVMGGAGSEIRDVTHTVLLESACFKPADIRATSRKLGLSTESSYRFERGVDIGGVEWASRRAAQLMAQLAGATAAPGVIDVYPTPRASRAIPCRYSKVNEVIGLQAAAADMRRVFASLGLGASENGADACLVSVPTFRQDLEREIDLVEEFARIYGLDKIPTPSPRAELAPGASDRSVEAIYFCRNALVGLGLREIMNYSFVSGALLDLFDPNDAARRVVLPNPYSADHSTMRNSLLPQMVETLGRNAARQIREAAFFEIGRVFEKKEDGTFQEETRLAIGLMGAVGRSGFDRHHPVTEEDVFLWTKGIWEALAGTLRLSKAALADEAFAGLEAGRSVSILMDGKPIGRFGLVKAALRKEWRLSEPVGVLEVQFNPLLGRIFASRSFSPVATFPSVGRDMALIVDTSVRHEDILKIVEKVAPKELERVELFDIFAGEGIGVGKKSMAYSFTYRSSERTLTDEDANRYHENVKDAVKKSLGVEIREG
ncbi:MAG TPA: phenylalanine--tRNA ligase subunit beta [Verrucomicrobia bacterium]|nr:MAG: phenylalanine--tRNA ligase subunit beta [Lentisphaerae bacterium GWF2_57_35]HBA83441.1 phenylalanine--tRNA ligase subunit beta [Verrucomicrobiota bacterium]